MLLVDIGQQPDAVVVAQFRPVLRHLARGRGGPSAVGGVGLRAERGSALGDGDRGQDQSRHSGTQQRMGDPGQQLPRSEEHTSELQSP